MSATVEAFFLPAATGRSGQRLCIHHPAALAAPRGAVVHVQPFFEEMNKSRRMVALQSRALAAAGYAVLQIDPLGCGDSSGDFADATWDDWVDDTLLAVDWLCSQVQAPLWLWGLRGGALVAAQAAARLGAGRPCNLLFWQPATLGKQLLQQFLRLRTAREMLDGEAKGAGEALRRQLAAGHHVHIAGYALGPALATGMEAAMLAPPAAAGRTLWIEVGNKPEPSPALKLASERWAAAGRPVQLQTVPGPAFWQTTEIETAPDLLPATLQALQHEEAVTA